MGADLELASVRELQLELGKGALGLAAARVSTDRHLGVASDIGARPRVFVGQLAGDAEVLVLFALGEQFLERRLERDGDRLGSIEKIAGSGFLQSRHRSTAQQELPNETGRAR